MIKIFLMLTILSLSNYGIVALFNPSVSVMIEEQNGKAEFARAESTRQIRVLEAKNIELINAKQSNVGYFYTLEISIV